MEIGIVFRSMHCLRESFVGKYLSHPGVSVSLGFKKRGVCFSGEWLTMIGDERRHVIRVLVFLKLARHFAILDFLPFSVIQSIAYFLYLCSYAPFFLLSLLSFLFGDLIVVGHFHLARQVAVNARVAKPPTLPLPVLVLFNPFLVPSFIRFVLLVRCQAKERVPVYSEDVEVGSGSDGKRPVVHCDQTTRSTGSVIVLEPRHTHSKIRHRVLTIASTLSLREPAQVHRAKRVGCV
jgi:hypothetical protein